MLLNKMKFKTRLRFTNLTLFTKSTLIDITKKSNLFLAGPPGAGKTALSRVLGKILNMDVYDVDNDHLENDWKMTVSEKLKTLGEDGFLKAEEGMIN